MSDYTEKALAGETPSGEDALKLYADESNWEGNYDAKSPSKCWIWTGPVLPPWEAAEVALSHPWHPASQPPSDDRRVLVFVPGLGLMIGLWYINRWVLCDGSDEIKPAPTLWRELPPLRKGVCMADERDPKGDTMSTTPKFIEQAGIMLQREDTIQPQCRQCWQIKPSSEFAVYRWDGRAWTGKCKACCPSPTPKETHE